VRASGGAALTAHQQSLNEEILSNGMLQNVYKTVLTKLTKSAFSSRALVLSSFFLNVKRIFPSYQKI
jgi:hypothetical protein